MSSDEAKVVGHTEETEGEPIGVWGEVETDTGYGLATPNDAKVEGLLELAGLVGEFTDGQELTAVAGSGLAIVDGALTVPGLPDYSEVGEGPFGATACHWPRPGR